MNKEIGFAIVFTISVLVVLVAIGSSFGGIA